MQLGTYSKTLLVVLVYGQLNPSVECNFGIWYCQEKHY